MIYLDHAATTPMRQVAIEAMAPLCGDVFANPSGSHRLARAARAVVDDAREQLGATVGVDPGGIIVTGGGTEADNLAVFGVHGAVDGPAVVVCSAIEHPAVLRAVERVGGTIVGVDENGHIDLEQLDSVVGPTTALVSVMAVNNEVGTVTDLAAVAEVVRRNAPGAVLHTDAVQAAPWLDVRTIAPLVDAMSCSAHKVGGPKGVGMLALSNAVSLEPQLVGGGQERDRRAGTHNVAGIVGFAAAFAEADTERASRCATIDKMRRDLVSGLQQHVPDVVATVADDATVPGIVHRCFPGVESEELLYLLDRAGLCASAGSSCASGAMEPSHVLAALGVGADAARGALRLSLGWTTTEHDISAAVAAVAGAVSQLRTGARVQ